MNLEGEEVGEGLVILKVMHSYFCTAYFNIMPSSRESSVTRVVYMLHVKDVNVGISIYACACKYYVNYSFPQKQA